jgi:hypothetical protein
MHSVNDSMNREQLIEKLVTTFHLSVDERKSLGPETIRKSEIAHMIARSLAEKGRFPPHARRWTAGNLVYEGYLVEVIPNGIVRLTLQRGGAISPRQLADERHWNFSIVEEAIDEFIRGEWPGGEIDGIRFLPS